VVTDASRYARGEIWWFENRDDLALISDKIRACELNGINATRTRRFGCFIQRTKLRARRAMTGMLKSTTKFSVDNYCSLRAALTGPRGIQYTPQEHKNTNDNQAVTLSWLEKPIRAHFWVVWGHFHQ